MSEYPTKKEHRVPLTEGMFFKLRNFIAGRVHQVGFNTALWFRVQARRRKAADMDPVWRESWWCLQRRYTMLAKKHTKLELKYLKQKDTIRKLRHGNR